MKKNVLLLIISTILFASCKKSVDEPAQSMHFNFSKEALAYVQMPANKNYIYKDSATGEMDSILVNKSTLENNLMPSSTYNILGFPSTFPAYYFQTFTLLLTKINGSKSLDWFYGIANANIGNYIGGSNDSAGVLLLERDRSLNADKGYVFNSFPVQGGVKMIIPNLTIEGKEYIDVVRFTSTNGLTPSANGYRAVIYYWAKGIGLIKRSISSTNSTKTWTLVKNG